MILFYLCHSFLQTFILIIVLRWRVFFLIVAAILGVLALAVWITWSAISAISVFSGTFLLVVTLVQNLRPLGTDCFGLLLLLHLLNNIYDSNKCGQSTSSFLGTKANIQKVTDWTDSKSNKHILSELKVYAHKYYRLWL